MATLGVGVNVNVFYEEPGGEEGQVVGTVATMGTNYLELTTASGMNVSIGWARIKFVES